MKEYALLKASRRAHGMTGIFKAAPNFLLMHNLINLKGIPLIGLAQVFIRVPR